MDKLIMDWYSKITRGSQIASEYSGPEEQAKNIKRCSILREINIEYGNSISYPNTGKTDNPSENYQ